MGHRPCHVPGAPALTQSTSTTADLQSDSKPEPETKKANKLYKKCRVRPRDQICESGPVPLTPMKRPCNIRHAVPVSAPHSQSNAKAHKQVRARDK